MGVVRSVLSLSQGILADPLVEFFSPSGAIRPGGGNPSPIVGGSDPSSSSGRWGGALLVFSPFTILLIG